MIKALWFFLTRPRGLDGRPTPHRHRGSRSGIALLMAIVTVALVTVIVTEVAEDSTARALKSYHQRDQVAANQLAESGANIYRLILVADRQIAGQLSGLGLSGMDGLWQMMPVINTGLLRFVFVSGGSVDSQEAEELREQGLTEEQREESREESRFSDKGFLDFDGDFAASIKPIDTRINVNRIAATCNLNNCSNLEELQADGTAQLLFRLMSGTENDQWFYDRNIDRWELIANLADWQDSDSTRLYRGGYEDGLYNTLDQPYLSKNRPLDTVEELRLVAGWTDEVMERFGGELTVYGSGKVNINEASDEVIAALLRAYCVQQLSDENIEAIQQAMMDGPLLIGSWGKPAQFTSWLENNTQYEWESKELQSAIKTQSEVFLVESSGMVGTSIADLEVVYDFERAPKVGRIRYWRMN